MIIKLNKSYTLVLLLGTFFTFSGAILIMTGWPGWLVAVLLTGVAFFGVSLVQQVGLKVSPRAVTALVVKPDGLSVVSAGNGKTGHRCNIQNKWITRYIVILNLETEYRHRRMSVLVTKTMCSRDDFRRLKRFLLHEVAKGSEVY